MDDLEKRLRKINKSSVIPVYYQLARILERSIRLGQLKSGESLPAENKIASICGISRMTVRRAISELVDLRLVSPQKGKGTFVTGYELDHTVFEFYDFFKEMRRRGKKPSSELVNVKIIKAGEKIAEKLDIPLNTKTLAIKLVLKADGYPMAYEEKYIVYEKQNPIIESEIRDPSLPSLVSSHLHKLPVNSCRILHVTIIDEQVAILLNTKPHTPAFLVEQILYDKDNVPIGWGKSIYRGDKYKLVSYDGLNLLSRKEGGITDYE